MLKIKAIELLAKSNVQGSKSIYVNGQYRNKDYIRRRFDMNDVFTIVTETAVAIFVTRGGKDAK